MTNCARVPGFIMGGFRDMNHMIAVKKTKSLDLNSVCVCLLLMCERGSCFCSTMLTLSQSKVCASFSYYYPAVAWPPSPAAPPHRSTRHRRAISCLINCILDTLIYFLLLRIVLLSKRSIFWTIRILEDKLRAYVGFTLVFKLPCMTHSSSAKLLVANLRQHITEWPGNQSLRWSDSVSIMKQENTASSNSVGFFIAEAGSFNSETVGIWKASGCAMPGSWQSGDVPLLLPRWQTDGRETDSGWHMLA